MSRAKDLYDRLRERRLAYVQELIAAETTEELFLDYKRSDTATGARRLGESDRKSYCKAISGFGNSDGGVIIWGVDCRHDDKRGDVPQGFAYLGNVAGFKSLLDGELSGLTLPPHGLVESIALPRQQGNAEGVVVTYIPSAFDAPLRGNADGAKDYYMRAGSSFLPVPHGILAGMFGRRTQPQLHPTLKFIAIGNPLSTDSRSLSLSFDFEIENIGRGIAEDWHVTFAILMPNDKGTQLQFSAITGHTRHTTEGPRMRWHLFSGDDFLRMIPGERRKLADVTVNLPNVPGQPLDIVATCGASGAASIPVKVYISESLLDSLREAKAFNEAKGEGMGKFLQHANALLHEWFAH